MKTGKTSLLGRLSGAFSIAMLALAFSIGGSNIVRAEDPEIVTPSLHEMVVVPLMKAIEGLEQRLASLEGNLSRMAVSFNSQRIATKQLCVADDSGAETCITKARLDALLKSIAQADLGQLTVSVTAADPVPAAEPTASTTTADETAATPADLPEDATSDAPEPVTTGSLNVEPDGAALVWYPDVEISIPAAAPSEE
jgi:hypothetical protein